MKIVNLFFIIILMLITCIVTIQAEEIYGEIKIASIDLNLSESIVIPDDYSSIQSAIDSASHGDVIVVKPGIYKESIDFKGRNITLRSIKPEDHDIVASTIIHGDENGTVITFSSGENEKSLLWGLTITGGKDRDGGGLKIVNFSSPIIRNNIIDNNLSSKYGGGAFVGNKSKPNFEENTFSANNASRGSAIYITDESKVTINNNIFKSHVEGYGVIHIEGNGASAVITGNTIKNNTPNRNSGGIDVKFGATATITDNLITNNIGIGDNSAGAISITFESSADIIDNLITDNRGSRKGAINISRDSLAKIIGNTIIGNEAGLKLNSGTGGGISVHHSEVEIIGNTINNNKANNNNTGGGGILILGDSYEKTVKIIDNTIINNQAYRWGGGIFIACSHVDIEIINNNISNNQAGNHNTATGGGIYLARAKMATIYGNNFSNNWAENYGGGIYIRRDQDVKGRLGMSWLRLNCPESKEMNNNYSGNSHGDNRYGGKHVFWAESK